MITNMIKPMISPMITSMIEGGGVIPPPITRYYTVLNGVDSFISIPDVSINGEFECEFEFTAYDNFSFHLFSSSTSSRRFYYTSSGDKFVFVLPAGEVVEFEYPVLNDEIYIVNLFRDQFNNVQLKINNSIVSPIGSPFVTGALGLDQLGSPWSSPTSINYLNGSMWNVKIWSGGDKQTGALIRDYPIDEMTATDQVMDYSPSLANGGRNSVDQSYMIEAPIGGPIPTPEDPTLYVNGPLLPQDPPTFPLNHQLPFSTVPVTPMVGQYSYAWEINPLGVSGRGIISYSLPSNNPSLTTGNKYRLQATFTKLNAGTSTTMLLTDLNNITIDATDTDIGQETKTLIIDFTVVNSVGFNANIYLGCGVSGNDDAALILHPYPTLEDIT